MINQKFNYQHLKLKNFKIQLKNIKMIGITQRERWGMLTPLRFAIIISLKSIKVSKNQKKKKAITNYKEISTIMKQNNKKWKNEVKTLPNE